MHFRRTGLDFSVVPSDRTRGNGHKMKHSKFQLKMRKNFTLRVTEPWPRLPREAVESASLDIFTESQNPRKVGVGRDLCGSSSPALLQEVQLILN